MRAYVSFVKPCASGSSVLVRGEAVFSIHFMNIYGKIIRFLQKGIWPLIMVVVSPVPRCADTTGDVDRSRAGEMLLKHEVWMMEEFVYPYATVDVRWLPIVNISAMGRAFRVRPAAIRQFRWGHSLAPQQHFLAQSVWYTIWHQSEDDLTRVRRTTLRVDPGGRVIEAREW